MDMSGFNATALLYALLAPTTTNSLSAAITAGNTTATTTTTTDPASFLATTPSSISSPTTTLSAEFNHTQDVRLKIEAIKNWIAPYILLFGIVSNVLTLLTLRQPKLKESPYTHLTALAVADLSALVLILIVQQGQGGPSTWLWCVYKIYIYYPFCNVAATLGIWVMVLMTLERCIFIKFPFWAPVHCTNSNARVKIVLVFAGSVVINFPRFFWYYVKDNSSADATESPQAASNISALLDVVNTTDPGIFTPTTTNIAGILAQYIAENASLQYPHITTEVSRPEETVTPAARPRYYIDKYMYETEFSRAVTWTHSVMLNFLPVLLLLIFNSFLVVEVRRQHARRNELGIHDTIETVWTREQARLTITLITIVCLFILLVLPSAFAEQHVAILFFPPDPENINKQKIAIYQNVTNFLMWLNLSINFLMYSFINGKFRRAFRRMGRQWYMALRLNRFKYACCMNWARLNSGRSGKSDPSRRQSMFEMVDGEEMAPFNNNKNNGRLLHDGHDKTSNHSVCSKDNSLTLSLKLDTSMNGQMTST